LKYVWACLLCLAASALAACAVHLWAPGYSHVFIMEDGPIESLSALLYLCAALLVA